MNLYEFSATFYFRLPFKQACRLSFVAATVNNMSFVERWLKDIHLEQYFDILLNNGYTSLRACMSLTDEGLNALGIDLPGHRKRILAHLPKESECENEYGNVVCTQGPPLSANSGPSHIPPPKAHCQPPSVQVQYINMNRNSKVTVTTSDDGDSDTIYDVPPAQPRPCKADVDANSSEDDDYVPADPAPMLPPKRSSKEDIDMKLGITTPTHENSSILYPGNNTPGPPLMKPVQKLTDVGNKSGSFDGTTGSLRQKPIPKPRVSLQTKKPKPVPRERSFVQSKSEGSLNIPADILQEKPLVTQIKSQETTQGTVYNIPESPSDKHETPQLMFENADRQSSKFTDEGASHMLSQTNNKPGCDQNETEPTCMVDNSLYETKGELVNNDALSCKDLNPAVNGGGKRTSGSPKIENFNKVEGIAISSELTKEESDNLANEMLYQETKIPRLKVDDCDQRVSYAGIWDMRSGSEKYEKIPVNEVKPFIRKDMMNTTADRSSFNAPPPSFTPPPLPKGFELALSPTLENLPAAPEVPPVVPPRNSAGTQKSTTSKKQELMQASVISELTKKQGAVVSIGSDIGEECPVYSSTNEIASTEQEPVKETVTPKTSVKRPPTPPPKKENPFKDMYDPCRGTYCLEGSAPDFGK